MNIELISKNSYQLKDANGNFAGSLIYAGNSLLQANLLCDKEYSIATLKKGAWVTIDDDDQKELVICKVGILGKMELTVNDQHYIFKKPLGWKLRFVLLNADKEELLALLPVVNWKSHGYDFVLQLNEEYENETDSFIILQALHCAVCSMAMMNGVIVPTVITV